MPEFSSLKFGITNSHTFCLLLDGRQLLTEMRFSLKKKDITEGFRRDGLKTRGLMTGAVAVHRKVTWEPLFWGYICLVITSRLINGLNSKIIAIEKLQTVASVGTADKELAAKLSVD